MRSREQRLSELRKALEIGVTGTTLVAEDLEPLIRANLLELSPLTALTPVIQATAHVHEIVRRTATPGGARHEGEMAPAAYTQSTYARRLVECKILRAQGQVSDFQQSASKTFTDCVVDEIEAQTEDMADLMEFSTIWGCTDDLIFAGDAYQYSGLYPFLLNDAWATCCLDGGAALMTLTMMDNMINLTKRAYRNLRNVQYVFLMSPQMISRVSGLVTRIQRDVPRIEFEGGFWMSTYDGIPMMPTGFVQPDNDSNTPTGASGTATGGTLADGTYRYRIASIHLTGEQRAGSGVAVTVAGGGGAGSVTLTFTADTSARLYAIYRTAAGEADAAANYDLIDIIAAYSYNAVGTPTVGGVTTYVDLGTQTALTTVHPLTVANEEVVFLVGLDPNQGLSRPVLPPTLGNALGRDPVLDLINYVPLVETTDTYQFRLKSYQCAQVPWGQIHAVHRRVRHA